MNKVFREVTIIRTGGGGSVSSKEKKIQRNMQLNRRRAIALDK